MLSDELLKMAATRIQIEFRDRIRYLEQEITQIKEESAARGAFGGSAMQLRIGEVIRQEYEIRAMIAWQTLSRVFSGQALPVDAQLITTLKNQLTDYLTGCHDLETQYQSTDTLMSPSVLPPLNELRQVALERIHSEIELSLLSAQATQNASGSSTIVNIYQPYGVVQTGSGSIATVVHTFGPDERNLILRALQAVEDCTAEGTVVAPSERTQIQEVVSDTRAELEKEAPNPLKLRGALSTLATTIQTLGSARSAYDLLKAAAALFGLHVP